MTNDRGQCEDLKSVSLEDALAECLSAVESDPNCDRDELKSRFPQWHEELTDFLSDWEQMEQLSSGICEQRTAIRLLAPTGTQLRYFGDYELLEEVGVGGMGVIFKARQISLDRIVAIKMILNPRHDRERFRIESEAAASLDHAHIVPIYEVGEFKGHPYFSMRFIEGGSLSERIDQEAPTPNKAAKLTATIARAVHFAHQRGILHRDLKPANVLLDTDSQPYISDFGLAKQVRGESDITQTGAILGTPGYMAPEQAIGDTKCLTVATDIHGLGGILYAALTGKPPYQGQSTFETLQRVATDSPQPIRGRGYEISRDLETICLKCLEKEASQRYVSAAALADDLDRFLRREPIEARPVSQVERFVRWVRRNPVTAALLTTVAALLIATTVVSSFLARSEHRAHTAAEAGRLREQELRQQENTARERAVATLADAYASKGFMAAQNGDPHESLLWFAGAAHSVQNDPQRVRSNLIRFESYRRNVVEPIAALWLRGAELSDIQFHDGGTQLFCTAGDDSLVWDYATDDCWHLSDLAPNVACMALQEKGDLLAIGTSDGRVVLANMKSRKAVHTLEFGGAIQNVLIRKDSDTLVIAAGNAVHLWNCRQSKPIGDPILHPNRILNMTMNRDGSRLITVCAEKRPQGQLRVFSIGSSEPLFAPIACYIENDSESRTAFWPTFIKDDNQLLVKYERTSRDGSYSSGHSHFRAHDAVTGKRLADYPMGQSNSLVVSPNSETIVNCGNRYARIIDLHERRFERRKERLVHRDRLVAADFSRDGTLVATGGWDRDVRLWAMAETDGLGAIANDALPSRGVLAHQTRVTRIQFSPDSKLIATVQLDGLIRVSKTPTVANSNASFHVNGGTHVKLLPPAAQAALAKTMPSKTIAEKRHVIDSVVATGTANYRATASAVTIYSTDGSQVGPEIQTGGTLIDADFAPNATQLATISSHRRSQSLNNADTAGELRFWSWPDGKALLAPLAFPSEPRSIAYRPDGKQLAVMCADGTVSLIDPEQGIINDTYTTSEKEQFTSNHPYGHGTVRYCATGRSLIAWGRGVWVFDTMANKLRYPNFMDESTRGIDVDISPNGKLLAIAGGRSRTVYVMDLETGQRVGTPIEHGDVVFAAKFHPDGQKLVTACRDGQARVYDWQTGKLLLRGMTHHRDVVGAAFTLDGMHILTVGLDGLVKTWSLDGRLAQRPTRIGYLSREILVMPDSQFAVVTGRAGSNEIISLKQLQTAPTIDTKQAKLLSEVLSSRTIRDGGTVKLTTSEWLERWQHHCP